jgi:TPR repeat protein
VQGHIWALEFLGFLYEQGECIPKNLIRAYAWYNLLTVQKHEWSDMRDNVAVGMTRSQIAKAQELSTNLAEEINRTPPSNPSPQTSKKVKPKIARTKPLIREKIPDTSIILP